MPEETREFHQATDSETPGPELKLQSLPVEVRESAPKTTPPSYLTAIIVVCAFTMGTCCAEAAAHDKACWLHNATHAQCPLTPVETPFVPVVGAISKLQSMVMVEVVCEDA